MQFLKKHGALLATILTALSLVFYLVLTPLTTAIGNVKGIIKLMFEGEFIFMLFVTILLIVASLVLIILSMKSKKLELIAIIVLIVAIIFTFLTKTFMLADAGITELSSMYSLGIGVILSAILNIVSVAILAVKKFVK